MMDSRTRRFHATLFVPLATSVEGVFEEVVRLLVNLEGLIGSFDLRHGEDEPPGPSLESKNLASFTASPTGFMAMSAGATVDVTKERPPGSTEPDGVRVSLFLHDLSDPVVAQVLDVLVRWGSMTRVTCAWACSADEERHHLFAKLALPRGSAEAFVGRNHREAVPGLFWWNYWSLDWLAKRGVALDGIPASWVPTTHPEATHPHVVVKGRFPWQEWERHLAVAEAWIDDTPGVFSIREMMRSRPQVLNELSAVRFLRRWK